MCALVVLASCAVPDRAVPDFARVPYQAISRETVVAIAMREWRLFGSPVERDDSDASTPPRTTKPEREPGLWQRVGEYWWLGLDPGRSERSWTGKHDARGNVFPPQRDETYAWSAAFVSYVMRIAGAGQRFPYSSRHSDYIDAGRIASLKSDPSSLIWAERPDSYAPQLGDLVCFAREGSQGLRFEDLPAPPFPAHCAFVVGIEPQRLALIGGNVDDAVTLSYAATQDGRLAAPGAASPWLVVIQVRYGS